MSELPSAPLPPGDQPNGWTPPPAPAFNPPPAPNFGPAPVPQPPPPPPRPPRQPMSAAAKRKIALVAAAAVLVCAGFIGYRNFTSTPSTKLVTEALVAELQNPALELSGISVTGEGDGSSSSGGITAQALIKVPLYEKSDTARFLAEKLQVDLVKLREAQTALGGANGARIRELAGISSAPDNPLDANLIRESCPAGKTLALSASYQANKQSGGTWQVNIYGAGAGLPSGKPVEAYTGTVLKLDDPNTIPALRALLASYEQYQQKVASAQARFKEIQRKEREARIAAIVGPVKAGALFKGTLVRIQDNLTATLWLEITSFNAQTRQVQALLRNDGGWQDSRQFQGLCNVDEEAGTYTLTLSTRANQVVRDAGPILSHDDSWEFQLKSDPGSGDLSNTTRTHTFSFTPLSKESAAEEIKQLQAAQRAIVESCASGNIYRGTVLNKSDKTSESVLLEFVKVEQNGTLVVARISSDEHPSWKRSLRGSLITNRYRADGSPLRLKLTGSDQVEKAPRGSYFRDNWDRQLQINPSDQGLSGEDNQYRYDLTRITGAELSRLTAQREARESSQTAMLRPGNAYYGTIRNGSFISNAKLRITKVDLSLGEITLTIDSRVQNGIYATFRGAVDAGEGLLSVGIIDGKYNSRGTLKVPFFSEDHHYELTLNVDENGITGTIVNRGDWVLNFPAKNMVGGAAPGSSVTSDTPVYPTRAGAYVLADGKWVPLPTNNGKVKSSVLGVFGLGELTSNPNKLADIVFDGVDTPPLIKGDNVSILFVGTLEAMPPNMISQYPQLAGYPAIELAPCTTRNDGKRVSELIRIAPGIAAFGERRCNASLEEVGENIMLLTCTDTLAPGSYALSVSSPQMPVFEVRIVR